MKTHIMRLDARQAQMFYASNGEIVQLLDTNPGDIPGAAHYGLVAEGLAHGPYVKNPEEFWYSNAAGDSLKAPFYCFGNEGHPVLGCVTIRQMESSHHLEGVQVHPAYRGEGLARQLMEFVTLQATLMGNGVKVALANAEDPERYEAHNFLSEFFDKYVAVNVYEMPPPLHIELNQQHTND